MKTLILGGIRSGKSKTAETLAADSQQNVTYIATATAQDEEMRARIDTPRKRRPHAWLLVEEPLELARRIEEHSGHGKCVLVDCLTLWLTNLLVDGNEAVIQREHEALITSLPHLTGDLIFVSNETNLGVVPANALARRYCDLAGALHQEVAKHCDRVVFMVAGLPWTVKGPAL
jgi:adenosylcobinamide kinase / adenosylcobinamide-phosphate guanylyltransferase